MTNLMQYSIVPVGKDKRPLVRWKEFQSRRPTPEEIANWDSMPERTGWAMILGGVSDGVYVVDIDSREAERTIFGILMRHMGDTLVVESSQGKRHFYFKSSEVGGKHAYDFKGDSPLVCHIDLQATGSYVLIPPSLHPSGSVYAVINDHPIRELSYTSVEWMLSALEAHWPIIDLILKYSWAIGQRHHTVMGLTRLLKGYGFSWPLVKLMITSLIYASESDEPEEVRLRNAMVTAEETYGKDLDEASFHAWLKDDVIDAYRALPKRVQFSFELEHSARKEQEKVVALMGEPMIVQEKPETSEGERETALVPPVIIEEDEKDSKKKDPGAVKLKKVLIDNGLIKQWFQNQHGETFVDVAAMNQGANVYSVDSADFKNYVINVGFKLTPPILVYSEMHRLITGNLKAEAMNKPKIELHPRIRKDGMMIRYDLRNANNQMVVITKDGWVVEIVREPLFVRHQHMTEQVTPISKGDPREVLEKLLEYLRPMTPEEGKLMLCHMLVAMVPNIPRMMMDHYGGQGSVKTTRAKEIRMIVDPSSVPLQPLKKDLKDLILTLDHNYFPIFDNLTKVDEDQSNTLCRAVTGDGDEKRKLYTDDDAILRQFRRCIQITGISTIMARPDLDDRNLPYKAPPVERYRREEVVLNEVREMLPEMLGACFNTLSSMLAIFDEVVAELESTVHLPRMADFAVWMETAGRALGYPKMQVFNLFLKKLDTKNEETLQSNNVSRLILKLLEGRHTAIPQMPNEEHGKWEKDNWEGTMEQLLGVLKLLAGLSNMEIRGTTDFPGNATWLSRWMDQLETNLKKAGIVYFMTDTSTRTYLITRRKVEE